MDTRQLTVHDKIRYGLSLTDDDRQELRKDPTSLVFIQQADEAFLAAIEEHILEHAFIERMLLMQEQEAEDEAYYYLYQEENKPVIQPTTPRMTPSMTPAVKEEAPHSSIFPQPHKTKLDEEIKTFLKKGPLTAENTTLAEVSEQHKKITKLWIKELNAKLGPTITLPDGDIVNVPQKVHASPTPHHVLHVNPGLASLVLDHEDPLLKEKMVTSFVHAHTLSETGFRGVLKKIQEIQEANPKHRFTLRERIHMINLADKEAALINEAHKEIHHVLDNINKVSVELFDKLEHVFIPDAPPPPPFRKT
jgi:hypothetical protein